MEPVSNVHWMVCILVITYESKRGVPVKSELLYNDDRHGDVGKAKRGVSVQRGCIGSLFIRLHPISNYTTMLHIWSHIYVPSQSARTVCLLFAIT
jgi:hypothetical protein